MTNNLYKKVAAGERFSMPARVYNELIDCLLERRGRTSDLAGNAVLRDTKNGLLRIRNDAGVELGPGAVLGLKGLVVDAGETVPVLRSVFSGVVPEANHRGRFAVLLGPLAPGAVGLAAVADVVATKVEIPAGGEGCRMADIAPGMTAHLQVATAGAARILWRAEGGAGVHRAIVALGTFPATFPVALEQVGGTQGTASAPATWTYDVKDPATGALWSASVNPIAPPHGFKRPPAGQMIPATHGHAHLGEDGLPVLGWIDEVADQEAC